jgi:hypothetical protein
MQIIFGCIVVAVVLTVVATVRLVRASRTPSSRRAAA